MAEKRGKATSSGSEHVPGRDLAGDEKPAVSISSPASESQFARLQLRGRWELASVLNFFGVFKPVLQSGLEISAEEIETALITPNDTLAKLHIALLKGIPPVSKNLKTPDAWVTVVCKRLLPWWPWVAEGDIPLIAAHGTEIPKYKELDPAIRLLILKALCEIRALQDDVVKYIDDALKLGSQLSTFRKDRIAGDKNGTAYWYDGDSVIGHRLYKETNNVEFKPKFKWKGHLTQPIISSQWETLATNLEEFQEISDKLSSSGVTVEATVAAFVKSVIIPVLEELQKKKERALKRQQRKTTQLDGFLNSVANIRSRRDRRPVTYTFDEYDRYIDEAIKLSKKGRTSKEKKAEEPSEGCVTGREDISTGGKHSDTSLTSDSAQSDSDDKYGGGWGGDGGGGVDDDDLDDTDYNDKDDLDDDELRESDKENGDNGERKHSIGTHRVKDPQARKVAGLRRSTRTALGTNYPKQESFDMEIQNQAETKKRLRQRPTRNPDYTVATDDGNSPMNIDNEPLDNIH